MKKTFWFYLINIFYKKKFINGLLKIPQSEWARISCELNAFKTPKELYSVIPQWLRTDGSGDYKTSIVYLIFSNYIEDKIGVFEVSKYWNTTFRTDKGKMTTEQHAWWWYVKMGRK